MSKKAEEYANKAYPNYSPDGKTQVDMSTYRFACAKGYEQAEKDTREIIAECHATNWQEGYRDGYEQAEKDIIERVCKWLEENATYTHPRKGTKTSIVNLNALREAMEEEL